MKRLFSILTAVCLTLSLTMPATAVARGWESAKTERYEGRQIVKDSDIEIRASRSTIIVSCNHSVQIKVFTILGQLVSSETLPAGTHQFNVGAHGVYIIKAGDITCKVALQKP